VVRGAQQYKSCFLRGPFRVYIARVCLQLIVVRSQEPRRLEIELENWVEFRESAVEGIRLSQEDFTCAVVQRYWECVI
jgi:hypothetical protein